MQQQQQQKKNFGALTHNFLFLVQKGLEQQNFKKISIKIALKHPFTVW